jgi:calmodulin
MWDLRKGDIIVNVNRRKLIDLDVDEAMAILAQSPERMTIGIARQLSEPESRKLHHDSAATSADEGDNSFASKIRAVFNEFDKDGGGTIDAEELHAAMNSAGADLSEQDLASMMKEADADGDGNVDFDEFFNMIKSIMSPRMTVEVKAPSWWEVEEEKAVVLSVDPDFIGLRKRASQVQLEMQQASEEALLANQATIVKTIHARKAAKEALKPKVPTEPILTKAQLKAIAIKETADRGFAEQEVATAAAKAEAKTAKARLQAESQAVSDREVLEETADQAYLASLPDWKKEKVERARQAILAMPEGEQKLLKMSELTAAKSARLAKKQAADSANLDKKFGAERDRNAKAGFGRRTNEECISMYRLMIAQKKKKEAAAKQQVMDAANTISWEQEQLILNELARGATAFESGGSVKPFANLFLHHRPVIMHNLGGDLFGEAIQEASEANVAFRLDAVAEGGIITPAMLQEKILPKMKREKFSRTSYISYGINVNRMMVEFKRFNVGGEHYDGGAACIQFIKVEGAFKISEMWIWNHGFDPTEAINVDGFEPNPAGSTESMAIAEEVEESAVEPEGVGYLAVSSPGTEGDIVEAVVAGGELPAVDVVKVATALFEAQRIWAKGTINDVKMADFKDQFASSFQDMLTAKINPHSKIPGRSGSGSFDDIMGVIGPIWLGFTIHSTDNDEISQTSEDTVVIKQTAKAFIAKPIDGKPMPKTSCVFKVTQTVQFMRDKVSVWTYEYDEVKMVAARNAETAFIDANVDEN